jgi:hypothetical protein
MAKNRRHADKPPTVCGQGFRKKMSAFSDRQFGLPFYSNAYGAAAHSVSTASVAAAAASAATHRNGSTASRLSEVLATHENRPTSLLTLGAVAASPRFRVEHGAKAPLGDCYAGCYSSAACKAPFPVCAAVAGVDPQYGLKDCCTDASGTKCSCTS